MASLSTRIRRSSKRPLPIEEINRQRILNPSRPTLAERARSVLWAVEEWWRRHVTHRELYRRLDTAGRVFQAMLPPEWDCPEHAKERLRRLRERAAHERICGAVPFAVPPEDYLLDHPPE